MTRGSCQNLNLVSPDGKKEWLDRPDDVRLDGVEMLDGRFC